MSKQAEDQAAKVIADLINSFALEAIGHIESVGSESVGACGRTKMHDGRYVAWSMDIGIEDDSGPDADENADDDEVALVATFPKPVSRLN